MSVPPVSRLLSGAVACACVCAGALRATPAYAQRDTTRAQSLPGVTVETFALRSNVRCNNEIVTAIQVESHPPFVRGMLDRWQFVSRAVSELHVTTNPEVVRRFLQLGVGDVCTELRRAESERILRAQPFLARAVVRPEPDGPGQVRLRVETVDEVTIVAGVRAATQSPQLRMLRVGEGNLLGEAIHASAEWRAGTYGRDGFGARVVDYQLFGRAYQLNIDATREQLGGRWLASVSQPYFTDLQRVAWRVSGGDAHDYLTLRREGDDPVTLSTQRTHADVGGLVRVGVPGRLSLFGLSLSRERESVDPTALHVSRDGPVELPDGGAITGRYMPTNSTRLNVLWGVRNVGFETVAGFDALTGVQDVREGFQLSAQLGRSMAALGSRDDDIFASTDVYIGGGTPRSFWMLQAKGEGRQDFDHDMWDGLLGSARLAWYSHLALGHTMIASAEWTGGWRTRVPFQLTLGEDEGGVRGYGRSDVAGARRAVLRVENRWYLGRVLESGEYGVGLFADAGRIWAGDVPFGVDSPVKVGLGTSILAAVPAGSQRLWRVDLAYPISADNRARFELRFSSSNLARRGWQEPDDVERSRERSVPGRVFRWP